MIIDSIMVLEPCRYCRGSGTAGHAGIYVLFCEGCGGQGQEFRERAVLFRTLEDLEELY